MAGHRMLVVEDHADSRRALAGLFTREGWHVTTAGTVEEALARLAQDAEPCCIILDLILPDGWGDSVIHRARAMDMRSRIVISTGADLDPVEEKRLADLAPDLVIVKPLGTDKVWAGICRVCGTDERETAPA